jgi:hypothetical protein
VLCCVIDSLGCFHAMPCLDVQECRVAALDYFQCFVPLLSVYRKREGTRILLPETTDSAGISLVLDLDVPVQ